MNFRLSTIFWFFALLASAMATFEPVPGIIVSLVVLGAWVAILHGGGRGRVAVGIACLTGLALVGLLLPAVGSAPEASLRTHCVNNMRHMTVALLNYESVHGAFPPAYTVDDEGKPMHSWRVLILPYIEEQKLYDAYHFDEPWDGPNNRKLADRMPIIYRCPSCEACVEQGGNPWKLPGENCTNYFAVVDPEAILRAEQDRPLTEVQDGTSKTILFLEAVDRQVNWMAPEDLSLEEAVELLSSQQAKRHLHRRDSLFTTYYQLGGGNVAYADGHIDYLFALTEESVRALLSRAGGEEISERVLESNYSPASKIVVIRWGHIFSFSVFVALALLPVVRWKQREGEKVAGGEA